MAGKRHDGGNIRGGALRGVLLAVVAFGSLAGAGLFHTWLRVESLHQQYRYGELYERNEALRREHDRLRLEVATLKAPERIERLARDRLGMTPPHPAQVVVLRDAPERAPARMAASERAEPAPAGVPGAPVLGAALGGAALKASTEVTIGR